MLWQIMNIESFSTDANSDRSDDWVRESRLFREWDRMKDEILLHKWYASEKAGHDIGWERAATEWFVRHGTKR